MGKSFNNCRGNCSFNMANNVTEADNQGALLGDHNPVAMCRGTTGLSKLKAKADCQTVCRTVRQLVITRSKPCKNY